MQHTLRRRAVPGPLVLTPLVLLVLLATNGATAQPAPAATANPAAAASDPPAAAQPATASGSAPTLPGSEAEPAPPASGPAPAAPPPQVPTAVEPASEQPAGPPPYGPPGYGPPGYGPPGYDEPYGYPPGLYGPYQPLDQDREANEPKRKFHSVGMLVAGIVLTGLGGLNGVAGLSMVASADENRTCSSRSCLSPDESRSAGIGAMVAGGVLMGVGIPLLIIGAQREPVKEGVDPEEYGQRGGATVTIGPGGVALRASF